MINFKFRRSLISPKPILKTTSSTPTFTLKAPVFLFKNQKKLFAKVHRKRAGDNQLEANTESFKTVPYEVRKDFLIILSKDFARYGAPLHRLEFLLDSIAESFLLSATFLVLPGAILLSLKEEDRESESLVIKVPFGFNMGKLSRVTDTCHELLHGTLSIEEAKHRLEYIRKNYNAPSWAPLVIYSLTSFIFCMIGFGGSWLDGFLSTLLGLLVGILQILSNNSPQNYAYLFEFSASLSSAFAAHLLSRALYPVCVGIQICVFSSLAILLPGLPVTLGIIEIATRNVVSGIIRLFAALFSALLLGYGYFLGSTFYPSPYTCVSEPMDWSFNIFLVPLGAVLIALALEARPHQMPIMMFVSSMGFTTAILLSPHFPSSAVATISTIVIGLLSNIYARFSRSPAIAPILGGILMLTPGSFGLKATISFLGAQDVTGQNFVSVMFTIAMSITIGLFLSNLLSYPFQLALPLPKHTYYFII